MLLLTIIAIVSSLAGWTLFFIELRQCRLEACCVRIFREASNDLADDLMVAEHCYRMAERKSKLMVSVACDAMAQARIFRSRALFAERAINSTRAELAAAKAQLPTA